MSSASTTDLRSFGRADRGVILLAPGHRTGAVDGQIDERASVLSPELLIWPRRGGPKRACARKAWERRRDVGNSSKPFGGTQWVFEPTRQSLANSRKRVLRPCR